MARPIPLLLIAAALGCSKAKDAAPPKDRLQEVEQRVQALEQEVERQRQASAAAAAYAPTVKGNVSDLDAPAADILGQLPGVAGVKVFAAAEGPIHRIIHLRDWR